MDRDGGTRKAVPGREAREAGGVVSLRRSKKGIPARCAVEKLQRRARLRRFQSAREGRLKKGVRSAGEAAVGQCERGREVGALHVGPLGLAVRRRGQATNKTGMPRRWETQRLARARQGERESAQEVSGGVRGRSLGPRFQFRALRKRARKRLVAAEAGRREVKPPGGLNRRRRERSFGIYHWG